MTRRMDPRWVSAKRSLVRGATEADALAALAGIWRRHGHETFSLNLRGPGAGALLLARWMGWLWCAEAGCHLTLAGVLALGEHLGRDLIAELIEQERLAAMRDDDWRMAA